MPRSSQVTDAGPIARLVPAATATPFLALNPKIGAPSLAAILNVPGTNRFNGRYFDVVLGGTVYNGGGASTAQFALYFGTDTVLANNVAFVLTPAAAIAATAGVPYLVTARLQYSNSQGNVWGVFRGFIGNVLIPDTVIANTLAGLSGTNEPVFSMVAACGIASANAGSFAFAETWAIEG